MSSQEYIRNITDIVPDELPTLNTISEPPTVPTSTDNNILAFISSITWQTWLIIILILALLGINVFAYLEKGTHKTASIINRIFGPILKLVGYFTLETTKQTVEASRTGTTAAVDAVSDTIIDTIDKIEDKARQHSNSDIKMPKNNLASSSMSSGEDIQRAGTNQLRQEDSLQIALQNARQTAEVQADDSRSSIQQSGTPGWCYIGEDNGTRTCAEIGVNDICMSGDIFPTRDVCINPNLRA